MPCHHNATRLPPARGWWPTAKSAVPVILLVLATATGARGLETPSVPRAERGVGVPSAPESVVTAVPTAIPVEEISRSAARTEIRLREIRRSTRRSVEIDRIVAELPDLQRNIERLQARIGNEMLSVQSRRHLVNLVGEWDYHAALISKWEALLAQRVETLAAAQKQIQETAALWKRTRDAASTASAPPAVRERATTVLQAVNDVEAQVRSHLDEALELENTVSELDLIASDAHALVESEILERRSSLFRLDSPPIWSWGGGKAVAPPPDRPRFQLADDVERSLRDFVRLHADRIRIHALLTVGLLLLVFIGRRRRESWRDAEPEIALFARLLDRPVSTAGLLAILLTMWLYPAAPVVVYQIASLLATPFLALLLPKLLPPHLVGLGFTVVVLFVVEPLPDLLANDPELSRAILLGEEVAGMAIALLAARSRWGRSNSRAAIAARVAVPLFGLSLAAGFVGARALSSLMFSGTIRSAYLGIFTYAAVLLLSGIWALLLRSQLLARLHAVRLHKDAIRVRGTRLLAWGGVLLWSISILRNYYVLPVFRTAFFDFVAHRWHIGTLSVSLGDVLAFFVVIYISVLISRFVREVLEEDVFSRLALPRGVPGTISTLVRYSLIALGFTAALAAARIPLDRFTVLAGALGVGIGFGLQNIVNNFVSGLILAFERPVQVGDTVEVGTFLGQIQKIGVRASTIRTFDGAEVLVPNGTLVSSAVINWTLSDRLRRIEVVVGVAYGTDPSRVLSLLTEVALQHSEVLRHPDPQALFQGFGDSSLNFKLRFWTGNINEWMRIQSDVTVAIHDRIRDEGIEIPFPQRDLHLRSVDEQAREVLGGEPPGAGPQDTPHTQR